MAEDVVQCKGSGFSPWDQQKNNITDYLLSISNILGMLSITNILVLL